jgi:hypothetical protein
MNEYGFDKELFPTPGHVVRRMMRELGLIKYRHAGKRYIPKFTMLEPSAGLGHIAKYLNGYGKLYVIEKNENCLERLQKDYQVIGNDFLTYECDKLYDYIVMNPPFSNGDEHLIKAWSILEKGKIGCLLNEETIYNLFSKRRQILNEIIEKHGKVIRLGKCFPNVNVNIVLVILEKKNASNSMFEFDDFVKEKVNANFDQESMNEIAIKDSIGNAVLCYEKVKELFPILAKSYHELRYYADQLRSSEYGKFPEYLDKAIQGVCSKEEQSKKMEYFFDFFELFREDSWNYIIHKSNVENYMTEKVKKEFFKVKDNQLKQNFNKENIENFFRMVFDNRVNILQQVVLDVFDYFTQYNKEDNRLYPETWKTNDKWLVNKRVILPNIVNLDFGYFRCSHYRYDSLRDIDKAFCFLTGKSYDNLKTGLYDVLSNGVKPSITGHTISSSEFFNIKMFKKGTIHLEFKDLNVWSRFNLVVSRARNWIPNHYKESDILRIGN